MDQRQFDRLARLLGEATDRRAGLKAALAAVLGGPAAVAALETDAEAKKRGKDSDRKGAAGPDADKRKKRKKTCKPACGTGYECVKQGKQRVCACASGVECGGACCLVGQACEGGTCVADPQPTTCLAFGEPCKNVGKRCCDGLSCASGQDGAFPVACYKSKGASCASSAECPFGMSCTGGVCRGNGGGGTPTGRPCAAGTTCVQPGATCTAYTTAGAPAGDHCTLPLLKACEGHPDCTCYNCWYVNDGAAVGSRRGRAASLTMACVQPKGGQCETKLDCARGLDCDPATKTCIGVAQCVPEGGIGCSADVPCCGGKTCNPDGTCSTAITLKEFGEACSANSECLSELCWYPQDASGDPLEGPDGLKKVCRVATGGTCDYDANGYYAECGFHNWCDGNQEPNVCISEEDYELMVPLGGTGCNSTNGPQCYKSVCANGTCILAVGDYCSDAETLCPAGTTCRTYDNSTDTTGKFCLLPNGATTCTKSRDCAGNTCHLGTCYSCAVATYNGPTASSTNGYYGRTIQEALDLKDANNQYVYSTVTIAPGDYDSSYGTGWMPTITRNVTIEACVSASPPLFSGTATVVTIPKPTSGTRSMTLSKLAFGGPSFFPPKVVDAIGGDAVTEKLTVALNDCTGTFGYAGGVPESLFSFTGNHFAASFTGCTFSGAMVKATGNSSSSPKSGVTVTDSTFTGRRAEGQQGNPCSVVEGNPRAFEVKDVALTLANTTVEQYAFRTVYPTDNQTAQWGYGGGIKANGGADILLKGTTEVKNNQTQAGGNGGGIYLDQSGTTNTLKIEDTAAITGNVAGNTTTWPNRGAGIYLSSAPANWSAVFLGGVTTTAVSGNKTVSSGCAEVATPMENQCRTPSGACSGFCSTTLCNGLCCDSGQTCTNNTCTTCNTMICGGVCCPYFREDPCLTAPVLGSLCPA